MMLYRSICQRGFYSATFAAIAVVLSAGAAIAHGTSVQVQTTEAVQIQATYDSGEPMAEAAVQVFAPDDLENPVFSGRTNEAGQYLFVPTGPGDWEVSVRQAGHGDIVVIPVEADGAIASTFVDDGRLSRLQRIVIAGAITWGCIGTALYFGQRGKRRAHS